MRRRQAYAVVPESIKEEGRAIAADYRAGPGNGIRASLYCAECDRSFKSDHGMKIHKAKVHGNA